MWCLDPLAPAQPEEALAAARPRPRIWVAGRGPFGVAHRLLGSSWPVGAPSGGGGSVLRPLVPTWPEEDLSWVAGVALGPAWPVEALGCGSTQVYRYLPGQRSLSWGGAQAQEPRYWRRLVTGGGWAPETHVALGGFGVGGPRPRTCLAREALSALGLSPRTSRLAGAFEGWASLLRCVPLPLPKETGPADEEGHHSGGPALCVPLSNGTRLPWFPGPPPPTFLAMEPLPRAAPDRLLTANSHPLPESTLQTPLSCTQPSSPPGGTQPRLGCAGPWQVPCAQASLGPTPHRPVAMLSSDPLKAPLCPC